ncbi:Cutinase transcription factor 1 beta [Cladophialophora carrionii]|uniref:Cutinase transcription factor 1 beta n=1 Tax=Cladophialophora carrionii TaxID=86049 RepID=A0A1C1CDP9_9EURO|nr:Cutinase transcription factor 1 beta [Cladophialophora carrionii]
MSSLENPYTSTSSGPNATERVVKKRASQACHHCRTRKVKCDLVKSGIPCHNCSSDGIECVILESKRSRKYRLQKRQLSSLVSLPPISQAQPRSTSDSVSSYRPNHGPTDIDTFDGTTAPANQDAGALATEGLRTDVRSVHTTPIIPSFIPNSFQSPTAITPNTGVGAQSQVGATSTGSNRQQPAFELPAYIRPSRPDIRQDDLEFLCRRGALSIPVGELRDQLLHCFVLYVYPFMPIVDLEDFMGALDGNDASPKISLIVFQAVLFSATAYVDLSLLQEAGYENRRAARADYYQKVKLLYDFDWDVDRIALIQSLLMKNYWYVSENDQKDPWHWLGICVSLATSIGLNQPFTYTQKDPKTAALWRRIWWCCLYRDRVIAISMRRPMRIKNEDIRLSLLGLDDFETKSVTSAIPCLGDCDFLTDAYTRTMLAEMCMEKIKLLVFVGQILRDFYHLRGFGGSTAESTMLYTPRRSEVNSKQYLDLQHALDQWYRNLPPSCWLVTGNSNVDPDTSTADALLVHRSVLRMLYLMATEALNRPQSLSKPSGGSGNSPTSKVKEAAEKIAEMVESMQEKDLIRFLPPLSVSFMLLALASFLVDIKAKGQTVGALPGQQFHVCVRAMLRLREIWPIADAACFLIGQMITKHQVGKISTPGIQPTPMDASDAPTNVWRNPETPRPNDPTHTPAPLPYGDLEGATAVAFTSSAHDQPPFQATRDPGMVRPGMTAPISSSSSSSSASAAAAALAQENFAIPYTWTEEDFEGDYGSMIEAHALNMDLAMPDADVFAYFENGTFGFNFEPSPNNDHHVSNSTGGGSGGGHVDAMLASYPSQTQARGQAQVHAPHAPGQQRPSVSSMVGQSWNPAVASQYMETFRSSQSI